MQSFRLPAAAWVHPSGAPIRAVSQDAAADLFGRASVVQLTPGGALARSVSIDLGPVRLRLLRTGAGTQIRTDDRTGRLQLGWIVERSAIVRFAGRPWFAGRAFVSRDDGLDICSLAPATVAWLDVRADDFAAELAHVGAGDAARLALTDESGALGGIPGLFEMALDLAAAGQLDAGATEALAASLMASLRAVLRASRSTLETASERRRYALLRSAERCMWEHVDESLTATKIAAYISRSTRTVDYVFNHAFGLGPIAYFKAQRLNVVRGELVRAPRRKLIDVAADFGFWHMGHFAADYRALFGETPSDTRRRALPEGSESCRLCVIGSAAGHRNSYANCASSGRDWATPCVVRGEDAPQEPQFGLVRELIGAGA